MLGLPSDQAMSATLATDPELQAPPKEEELIKWLCSKKIDLVRNAIKQFPTLDLNHRDSLGLSLLDCAIMVQIPDKQKIELVTEIVGRVDEHTLNGLDTSVESPICQDSPPIHSLLNNDLISTETRLSLLGLLLQAGANPNQQDYTHQTPLRALVNRAFDEEVLQPLIDVLIEYGASSCQSFVEDIFRLPLAAALSKKNHLFIRCYLKPLLKPLAHEQKPGTLNPSLYLHFRKQGRVSIEQTKAFELHFKKIRVMKTDPLLSPLFRPATLAMAKRDEPIFNLVEEAFQKLYPENLVQKQQASSAPPSDHTDKG